jgi:hypothetical protein
LGLLAISGLSRNAEHLTHGLLVLGSPITSHSTIMRVCAGLIREGCLLLLDVVAAVPDGDVVWERDRRYWRKRTDYDKASRQQE